MHNKININRGSQFIICKGAGYKQRDDDCMIPYEMDHMSVRISASRLTQLKMAKRKMENSKLICDECYKFHQVILNNKFTQT